MQTKQTGDIDILRSAVDWRRAGSPSAIAIVVATWGSAPRPLGSLMAVNADGSFVGSVSGGCVEGEVVTEALALLRDGGVKRLDFTVSDDDARRTGSVCGGQLTVFIAPVIDSLLACLETLIERQTATLTINLTDGASSVSTNVDPGVIEPPLFARVFAPPLRLLIVGGVHIAQALVQMATAADYQITLIDPRDGWATAERFPGVTIDKGWPSNAIAGLAPDPRTAIVTLSHDSKLDDPALAEAVTSPAFYIGALGNPRTHAARLERLREFGVSDQAAARIHGPIGLRIGAKTPAEIAVSILAEMTDTLRKNAS
mgnify:CR=1 FL=1